MSKTHKSLADAFDIEHEVEETDNLPAVKKETLPVERSQINIDDDLADDYVQSRETYKRLIETGESALHDLHSVAQASEHPRAYEVLSTMIRTITDTTKELTELNKKTREMINQGKKPQDQVNSVTVDKAVFVGTTEELLNSIKKDRK